MLIIYIVSYRREKRFALVSYSAADAQNFRLENIDYINNADCKIICIIIYDFSCGGVAFTHCVKSGLSRNFSNISANHIPHNSVKVTAHFILCLTDKGCCGAICFPAASASASATLTAELYNHMTKFTGGVIAAVNNLSANDDTASHACSESNSDKIINTVARSCYRLSESRTVGVVFNINGKLKLVFHNLLNRNIVKIKVIGIFDNACFTVNRTGGSYSD